MAGLTLADYISAFALSLLGAGIIIVLVSLLQRARVTAVPTPIDKSAALLFEGASLIDASPMARSVLADGDPLASDLDRAVNTLACGFPGLREALSTLDAAPHAVLRNETDPDIVLELEGWDGMVRMNLRDVSGADTGDVQDRFRIQGLKEENDLLRSIAYDAPQLIWMTDTQDELVWANRAYLEQAEGEVDSDHSSPAGWPPPPVFPGQDLLGDIPRDGVRLSAKHPSTGENSWFTVFRIPRSSGTLYVGECADALVQAEVARRNFVQTLTKTFAQLSTGLAVFDKDRRLVLFNPALVDLISLPVEFLITQPSFTAILNRMREERMLPEQRDFGDWRNRILNIELAAEEGTYCENWSLLNGCTYRITGRPHPDGALAFLIEDISADLSLTRQYRSEIALGQSVIDSFEDAVAVFTGSGLITLTNTSFSDLWGFSDDGRLEDLTLDSAIERWEHLSQPSPFWEELRLFINTDGPRQKWEETVLLLDGRILSCRVAPISGGGTICTFSSLTDVPTRASFSTVRGLTYDEDAVA